MKAESAWRIGAAILAHVAVIAAWHLFVVWGEVPRFVMPTPGDTVMALLDPDYRWWPNIVVTATEIYGGYALAVVTGVVLPCSSPGRRCWRRS